ncbi:MAG: HIT family protein [Bacteriovoracia bacterium]
MNDCIFCKIAEGEIPAAKIVETESGFVIPDISPQAPMHLLVVPKLHVPSLNDLTEQERASILPMLYDLADIAAQEKGFKSTGYRTVINNQPDAGQTVFHLHMHVLGGGKLRGTFGAEYN